VVRIKKVPFTVIGVLARKGQTSWGQDQDDTVIIPLSTAKKRVLGVSQANARFVGVIQIKAVSPDLLSDIQAQAVDLLRQRHRLQPYQDNDFDVRNLAEMFAVQAASTKTMTILLGAIASVSLLVGGIGIMNIMLVSVTERTREIGIRKSIGAQKSDILSQFMIEAVILCEIGGAVGVLAGIGGGNVVSILTDSPAVIPWDWVAIGLVSCSVVGFVFGVYPAWKAANLDPIEALRYE
jgi:putative ABC transport system permease protein